MLTFLLQNDNSIVLTESTGCPVEKSNSINAIRIIVPKIYEGEYNMAEFDGLFEYKLPISGEAGLYQLELADDNYKDDYLLYTLPGTTITTAITKECGEVEFSLTFIKAELDADGNTIERVRQCAAPAIIKVVPISTFLSPSEAQLSALAAMYLENKKVALALTELANQLSDTKLDDVALDIENGKVIGTANGVKVGTGIDLDTLNAELVEHGASQESGGNIKITHI